MRHSTDTVAELRLIPAVCTARIGMLNNSLSGGNRKGLQKIRKTAAAMLPEILQREVQTPDDVAESLGEFARREVTIIIVNGGDGTVQAALTTIFNKKFFETSPVLAVLPSAGTTSMIAGDVGLKGFRISALQRLCRWSYAKNNTANIIQGPVLRVQVPSEKEPVYGMFFGTAGIYQASLFCNQKIHARGVRGEKAAGAALARFLLAVLLRDHKVISAVPIATRLNQNPAEQQKYLLLFVTSLRRSVF
jgi:diacylglycerol kinase (ATP)